MKTITQKQPSVIDRKTLILTDPCKSAESIINNLFSQTEDEQGAHSLALGLVGAALGIRNQEVVKYLGSQPYAYLRILSCVFVIDLKLPTEDHLKKVGEILKQRNTEIWLLTREDRVAIWKIEISKRFGKQVSRIVVTSVESFVGQNISELAGFLSSGKIERFKELVELYNSKWVETVGSANIRISLE